MALPQRHPGWYYARANLSRTRKTPLAVHVPPRIERSPLWFNASTFPKKGSPGTVHTGTDPRLVAAEIYIKGRKGKGIIAGLVLNEHVAWECAEGALTDGELQSQTEQVRQYFRGKVALTFLASYRHQYGGKGSDWVYEDKSD